MNKFFGDARVSTVDQSTYTQVEALEKYGCDMILKEKISDHILQKPKLDEILSLLIEGDTIAVFRLFRLGRSRDHLIDLAGNFAEKKIAFKALDLGIDSSTPAGKMVIGIFASLAEYDREMILEKTRAGQMLAKSKGKHTVRPSGVNEVNFLKVKRGFEKGLSVSEIVSLTGISISSVKRYRWRIRGY